MFSCIIKSVPSLITEFYASGMSTLPGKVEKAPGPLKAHEVVTEVEVGDILAVKEIFRHCFQTVAGEVHHADRLWHHLQTTALSETSGLASRCDSSAKLTGQDISFIRIQPLWGLVNGSTLSCEKAPQQGFNRRGSQVLMLMLKNKFGVLALSESWLHLDHGKIVTGHGRVQSAQSGNKVAQCVATWTNGMAAQLSVAELQHKTSHPRHWRQWTALVAGISVELWNHWVETGKEELNTDNKDIWDIHRSFVWLLLCTQ